MQELEQEIWKTIPGFSRYEVSNLGNVRSYVSRGTRGKIGERGNIVKKPRLLKQHINNGYMVVGIKNDNNKQKQVKVNSLVMLAFVGERPHKMVIRHKNNRKEDNRLENLEYGTYKENYRDSCNEYRTRERKNKREDLPDLSMDVSGSHKLNRKRAKKIRELYETGKYTQDDLAYMFDMSNSGINRIILKQRSSDDDAMYPNKNKGNNSDYTRKMVYLSGYDNLSGWCSEQVSNNRYDNFSSLCRDAIRCLRYFNEKHGDWRTQISEKGD